MDAAVAEQLRSAAALQGQDFFFSKGGDYAYHLYVDSNVKADGNGNSYVNAVFSPVVIKTVGYRSDGSAISSDDFRAVLSKSDFYSIYSDSGEWQDFNWAPLTQDGLSGYDGRSGSGIYFDSANINGAANASLGLAAADKVRLGLGGQRVTNRNGEDGILVNNSNLYNLHFSSISSNDIADFSSSAVEGVLINRTTLRNVTVDYMGGNTVTTNGDMHGILKIQGDHVLFSSIAHNKLNVKGNYPIYGMIFATGTLSHLDASASDNVVATNGDGRYYVYGSVLHNVSHDVTFAQINAINNRSATRARDNLYGAAVYNTGSLGLVAQDRDITFTDNALYGSNNIFSRFAAVYQEESGTLSLNAGAVEDAEQGLVKRKIRFNDRIEGKGRIEINRRREDLVNIIDETNGVGIAERYEALPFGGDYYFAAPVTEAKIEYYRGGYVHLDVYAEHVQRSLAGDEVRTAVTTYGGFSDKTSFIVKADENLPSELYGDDLRISQVIINLLNIARENNFRTVPRPCYDGLNFVRSKVLRFVNNKKRTVETTTSNVCQRRNQKFFLFHHFVNVLGIFGIKTKSSFYDVEVIEKRLHIRIDFLLFVARKIA